MSDSQTPHAAAPKDAKDAREPRDAKEAKNPKDAQSSAAAKPAGPPAGAGLIVVLAVAAAALVGGGGIGMFLIAPAVVAARNAPHPAAEPKKEEGKGKPKAGKVTAYKMDNIVVNPAGSNGTRFLMASIAVEIDDPKVEAAVHDRDFEMRDAVVATLERQTLDMLTHPGARDTVRNQLEDAFTPIVGSRPRVYLTQFVIQ